jgi:hypothetical protein
MPSGDVLLLPQVSEPFKIKAGKMAGTVTKIKKEYILIGFRKR